MRTPRGVVGLCVALFAFILICNWLAALPTEHYLPPPTADVNLVYPLMLLVIIWVNVAGIRANGVGGYFGHLTKPYVALAPIEFITLYFSRPVSLALRLWGNIFAGGIMVAIIALHARLHRVVADRGVEVVRHVRRPDPGPDLHPAHDHLLQ